MDDDDDHDEDDDTVVGNCLHCNAPPPPRSSIEDTCCSAPVDDFNATATRVQVSCDDCRSFICDGCHWCHEFQANHEIRVCDRCDAFYCRGCDEMDQCEDCSEVVCNTCSTLMSCKFCGCGLCEDCATACGRCGIVLCSRDAKFAVECDTCKMSYCLVCLASGTKDPCVRCGHRPSKRVEQLVHLRLKSIYKAFKQSGASVGPDDGSSGSGGGGSLSGTVACNAAAKNKVGADASGGKYSSTLRSLADAPNSDSKDNIGVFDQSMANEVAAVLQTASNAMSNADGDTAGSRRSRGARVSSHSSSHDHSHLTGGGVRNRPRANSASQTYYRKTQAELEAAAAAAEADAEAAAAALLAELDEEDATSNAIYKKSKKKKKKKEKKKDSVSESEQSKSNSIAEHDVNPSSQKKRTDRKISAATIANRELDEDSSDDEINVERLVGRTKSSTKPLKKKERKEVEVEEKIMALPISKPKVEPAPPTETSTDFDKELAILLSSDDEQGLENFLDKLRGVPGLGAARKTAKKALKRMKEAKEPAPVENEKPSFQDKTGVTTSENERKSSKYASKSISTRPIHVVSSSGTNPTQTFSVQQEPLLRIISRTATNTASASTRASASNPASAAASRGECVMHMSPAVVGWVIGKGGQRIRDMMEESGAKIWIDQESMAADEARVVYVSGKRSSVDLAVKMVKDLVAKAPLAANAVQTPPPDKSYTTDDEVNTATSLFVQKLPPTTVSSKEPTSFASAIASTHLNPTPATKPDLTQEGPVLTRGWPDSQNVFSQSPVIPLQSNIPKQPPVASMISDNVRKQFACDAQLVSHLLGTGAIDCIQVESGASLLVDQSVVPPNIIIFGEPVNVNKAEQFLRRVLGSQNARHSTLELASSHEGFDSVDSNALANVRQGFEGISLSSCLQTNKMTIPLGYNQTSQPSSLGLFLDSQFSPQQALFHSKSLSSQSNDDSVQYNQPESWASQNRAILPPQFPPHASVSDTRLGGTNLQRPSAFGLHVDLNQPSYKVSSQSPLPSHHVLPDRIHGAPLNNGLSHKFGDTLNQRGEQSHHSELQHSMQFDASLFTDAKQRAAGTGTLGGSFEPNLPRTFNNNDSQMVDNMFASLGGIGGLLNDLNPESQQTWAPLDGWGDNASTQQSQSQHYSRFDSLDSTHQHERRGF